MAHTLTINGTPYSAIDLARPLGSWSNGIYWALPPFGVEPCYTGPRYNDTIIPITGEKNGMVLKRLSYAPRQIFADLVVVNDVASARAAVETLLSALMQDGSKNPLRYTITLPDGSAINGCSFMGVSGRYFSKNVGGGKVAYVVPLVWQQLSDAN